MSKQELAEKSAEIESQDAARDAGVTGNSAAEADGQSTKEKRTVPLEALEDERHKRQQEREARIRAEAELNAIRQAHTQTQTTTEKSDEDWEKELWAAPIKTSRTIAERIAEQRDRQRWNDRAQEDREEQMEEHADYEDAERAFAQHCNPGSDLHRRFMASANPARFAYRHGKKLTTGGKPAVDEAEVEKRIRAKVENELREKGILSSAADVPKSQASARGATGESGARSRENPFSALGWDAR